MPTDSSGRVMKDPQVLLNPAEFVVISSRQQAPG
jgi:hypothetical protein